MKSKKEPGADRITAEVPKADGEQMAEMLLNIYNTASHQDKVTNRLLQLQNYHQPGKQERMQVSIITLRRNLLNLYS